MKGIAQAIPTYLYVLVALVVGVMMIIMISKYSRVFFPEDKNVIIGGTKEGISKSLVKIIEKCWEDHRRGLDDKSDVCKEITFESILKIDEKDLNEFLDCEKLPNSDCSPDDCSSCGSDYFDDTDKILWLTEPENTKVKISYDGDLRRITVVGSPCNTYLCICKRDCKKACIEGLSKCNECPGIPDCANCFEKCEWCEDNALLYEHPEGLNYPYNPFCNNNIDDDCDGTWDSIVDNPDNYDTDCCSDSEYPGYCDDGIDNDCDGMFDSRYINPTNPDDDCPFCGGPAYLHGDIWPFWYNYRVQCDYEHKMYWLCQKQGRDCSSERSDWNSCNVCRQQDGICIPRTRSGETDGCCDESACCNYNGPGPPDEATHFFGNWRSCTTYCDTRDYDYDLLWGYFYGKSWGLLGDWSVHFFDSSGININHRITRGTKGEDNDPMSQTSNDALGYFGCYELPVGDLITVLVSLHDWEGNPATNPRDIIQETFTPEPGKHYIWTLEGIQEWDEWDRDACEGPPSDIANRLGGISCSNAV